MFRFVVLAVIAVAAAGLVSCQRYGGGTAAIATRDGSNAYIWHARDFRAINATEAAIAQKNLNQFVKACEKWGAGCPTDIGHSSHVRPIDGKSIVLVVCDPDTSNARVETKTFLDIKSGDNLGEFCK